MGLMMSSQKTQESTGTYLLEMFDPKAWCIINYSVSLMKSVSDIIYFLEKKNG
jgi:hypothetical protein